MRRALAVAFCWFFLPGLLVSSAQGSELVWTPINPSFGGSSFNGQWLLSQAEAQNTFTARRPERVGYWGRSPLENFTESLNRQILSRLASQLVRSAFGEAGLEEGHYEIGDYMIDISPREDGLHVTINDLSTGNETEIIVPYY